MKSIQFLEDALYLFDKVPKRDSSPLCGSVTIHRSPSRVVSSKAFAAAIFLFAIGLRMSRSICELNLIPMEKERGGNCDAYTHTILIDGLCQIGEIDVAQRHWDHMKMLGLDGLVAF
ncbi:pentatricopeptide repeat-containing protein [Striga asiatica]|uniref:Pentatricopeptide repeat-containing protein n=1 Tax=Striga asiatica TaxID=4170 RepID=A0A5A7P7T6_STRAF|nr:pentatricopeptide repeat-containing protein [Striga asiatica]